LDTAQKQVDTITEQANDAEEQANDVQNRLNNFNTGIALSRATLDLYRGFVFFTGQEIIPSQIVTSIGIGLGIIQYAALLATLGEETGNVKAIVAAAQIVSSSVGVIQSLQSLQEQNQRNLDRARNQRAINRIGDF
jgi:hypothetical protein